MAITARDCHICTSYYVKKYKEKYGVEPSVNRNTARWSWANILEGMSPDDVKSLLDYYFTTAKETTKRHSLDWFFYNYDKLIDSRTEAEKDRARREKMRRESEQRAKEWREKFGNQGIAGN